MEQITKRGFSGHIHTEESKKKISESVSRATRNNIYRSKHWIIIRPNGDELQIFNLREFCRKNRLDYADLLHYRSSHGFKLKPKEEPSPAPSVSGTPNGPGHSE